MQVPPELPFLRSSHASCAPVMSRHRARLRREAQPFPSGSKGTSAEGSPHAYPSQMLGQAFVCGAGNTGQRFDTTRGQGRLLRGFFLPEQEQRHGGRWEPGLVEELSQLTCLLILMPVGMARKSCEGPKRQPAEAWRALAGIPCRQRKRVRAFKLCSNRLRLMSLNMSLWRQ